MRNKREDEIMKERESQEERLESLGEIMKKHRKIVVGFSGGKDSTVVLDMARSIDQSIIGVFCNTGVEARTTYEYIKRCDNIVWLKPEMSFWKCIEKYGWPTMKGKGKNRTNHCCTLLKEKPMKKYIKEYNIDLVIDGLTADESRQRWMFLSHYGVYHYVKSWNVWKCHPIHDWKEREVWDYIRSKELDYNKGYDGDMERSGCQPCTAYCTWKIQLAKENFGLYAKVQSMRSQSLLEEWVSENQKEKRR